MKVYLCGQKYFGQEVLKLLLGRIGIEVVGVSSPAWRNEKLPPEDRDADNVPDRLRAIAERNDLQWLPAGRLRAELLPRGTDLIIAAHSHDFIGRKTRDACRVGALGYHPSLLPIHRGRDAVRWAVKLRERVTGGTAFWLNDTVDGGPIAAQDFCFVRRDDTAELLWRRELQPMGLRLLSKVLDDLLAGRMVAVPQDASLATWEPSLNPPPLFRPELPMLGGGPVGFVVDADAAALAEARLAMYM